MTALELFNLLKTQIVRYPGAKKLLVSLDAQEYTPIALNHTDDAFYLKLEPYIDTSDLTKLIKAKQIVFVCDGYNGANHYLIYYNSRLQYYKLYYEKEEGPAWEGTIGEFTELAIQKADLLIPGRLLDEKDCDYKTFVALYTKFLQWLQNPQVPYFDKGM